MATGDIWKVTLGLALDAVECRPGFYLVEGTGGGGTYPAQDVALAVESAIGASALAGFVQNLDLKSIIIEDVQPADLASFEYFLTPQAGTIPDDNPPPPQDTMLIRMHTDVKGVTGVFATQGRMYMPGIYSTGQVSGFLTITLQTALGVFVNKLAGDFVDDGTAYQMHVVSFTPNSSPRTVRAINPVTRLSFDNQVRSQRRRQAGVGI